MFYFLTDGLFLEPRNVTSLLVQNGYILILAIGMVMVIIAGHIDLSVGSVSAFVGASCALAMDHWGLPWPMAILLGIALGILVGMWQGYWVAYIGIPAFIVTLAGMLLFRGLDLMILDAQSIPVPEAFQKIANGYLPEMGPNTGYHNPTLVLTLLGIAFLTYFELKNRADRKKYDDERAADGGGRHQAGHLRRPAPRHRHAAGLVQGPAGRRPHPRSRSSSSTPSSPSAP